MNFFLPPTTTPVEEKSFIEINQTTQIMETVPKITHVEDEVQYVKTQPEIQYDEEPQIQYIEQPKIEYNEQPKIQYVEVPKIHSVEAVQQQPVVAPVASPSPLSISSQDDFTKYYDILNKFGPIEPDEVFQFDLDEWKKFYKLFNS